MRTTHLGRLGLSLALTIPATETGVTADPPASRRIDVKKYGSPDVREARLSPDGSVLVVTGSNHKGSFAIESVVTVWDAATGRHLRSFRGNASAGGGAVAFSP